MKPYLLSTESSQFRMCKLRLILFMDFIFRPNNETRILTKGDNNPVDDRGLYPKGQLWIKDT